MEIAPDSRLFVPKINDMPRHGEFAGPNSRLSYLDEV